MIILYIFIWLLVIGFIGALILWSYFVINDVILNEEEPIWFRIAASWLISVISLVIPLTLNIAYSFVTDKTPTERTVNIGMNSWKCTAGHSLWIPIERHAKTTIEAHEEYLCDKYERNQ